jgi:hypothetical protein
MPRPGRSVGDAGRAFSVAVALALASGATGQQALAQAPPTTADLTSPVEHFGFEIGADYHLANYTRFESYWRILADESERMVLREIGPTAEGRTQLMAVVTSPANLDRLDRWREISHDLALGVPATESMARAMADEGKAVVWIDGGLHATEVLGAHQLIETSWQMVSRNDPEVLRILDDVVILFVHANPDGMELVSDWYMRNPVPEERSTGGVPRLYHKYVGHDNNRDSYLVSQPETENMARVLYIDWMPQILYNHHQVGPAGAIMWAPPFRYPANYHVDPLVLSGIEEVGMAMQSRFLAEGKPGVTMREGGPFSTWWNGGLRTTAYFHNIIGLLTETQGNPTPIEVPFVPSRTLPDGDYLDPIAPQTWHFRQSVDYSVTANMAVLDYASRNRERLLMNIWRAARSAIDRGSRDSWTVTPTRMAHLRRVLEENGDTERFIGPQTGALAGYFSLGVPTRYYEELRRPEDRDPRGYILPADQADFPTATRFVNALIKNGVRVLRAASDFQVGGVPYPAGSFVVKTAQAYGPHVLDMFEPQDHPDDFAYEGGPPVPPYDNAGYTLAYQMGVEFDRVLEAFDGPFEAVEGRAEPWPGVVADAAGAAGFLLSHAPNDAAVVTNRLLAEGGDVFWLTEAVEAGGRTWPEGTLWIPASSASAERVEEMASELGLSFQGTLSAPSVGALDIDPVRVGLWDEYGGSMPSGWTRFLFDSFEFPYETVFPRSLDEGELRERFDVLVFVTGAVPASDRSGGGEWGIFGSMPDEDRIPEAYREWLGRVTVAETVPHLLEFLEEGGTIVAIGTSTAMGSHAGLALSDHLVQEDGGRLPEDRFYIPGSVLRMSVDNTNPVAYGLPAEVDVFFNNSPVLRLEAPDADVEPVLWFEEERPLRSGWAWGQEHLEGGVGGVAARVGEGKLFLFGPEITHRGQPHGTFKLLFNGIFLANARERRLETVFQ